MSSHRSSGRSKTFGFTLIELMIVVAVVALLSVIALPSYAEFVKRGTRADAQAFLMEAALRQQQQLVDRRAYVATLGDLGLTLPKSLEGKYTVSVSAPAVVPPSFAITAVPQGAQTTEGCGTLSINHFGTRSPAHCWQ